MYAVSLLNSLIDIVVVAAFLTGVMRRCAEQGVDAEAITRMMDAKTI
jgi:hypothetical protein